MNKKLPSVFASKINKTINNNERCNVSKNEEIGNETNNKSKKNINQKINDIFSSYKYVYKANVVITTNDGEFVKQVIGKKGNNLITYDNELINISNIKDIKFKE